MIVSQTCDIVRSCRERPFVEVCPLVELNESMLQEVKRLRRPRYIYVPGISESGLAADLDRVMTVEKAVVATWQRRSGCATDQERRDFAKALARKRTRVAFPDDFVCAIQKFQDRLRRKHGKNSDEGRALRALLEIRVRAAPAWNADQAEITLWFIRDANDETFEGKFWDTYLEGWLNLIERRGRFREIQGAVVTLDDLSARDYVESDPLDLDHLSMNTR